MQVKIPSYYKKFKCIAGKCSDTCCDGWKITIDRQSLKIYKEHEGVLKDRLKENIITDNGNAMFLPDGGRCPFLNSSNTCDIYIFMGENALSNVCSAYPRKINVRGSIMEAVLNLSCPEAARLMLYERDGIVFEKYDDGIQADTPDTDMDIFMNMLEEVLIKIANDRRIPFKKRIVMILFAADSISAMESDADKYREFVEGINSEGGIMELAELFPDSVLAESSEIKNRILSALLNMYGTICCGRKRISLSADLMQEYLEKDDAAAISGLEVPEEYIYQFENYITYFVFRHLKECQNGREIFEMAVMMCASYAIIRSMDLMCIQRYGELSLESQIEIMHYYSKIVEHSAKDYKKIMDIIKDCGFDSMAYMCKLIA